MKTVFAVIPLIIVLTVSCTSRIASPGTDIRSELPEKTHTILDAWPNAEEILLIQGRPVNLDTYTAVHGISGEGILVIEVRSHDFDPVAVLLDGEGNLLAFNDDWGIKSSARLVVQEVPSGTSLLVFSPDDTRGLYDVLVREGSQRDLDEFISRSDLAEGSVRGWIEDDRYDVCLDRILRAFLGNDVYVSNFPVARLFPFSIEETEGLISLLLESEEFDTYLVLVEVKGDVYRFISYSDDYSGSDSRIVTSCDPGNYIALVMPYSSDSEGEFFLTLEVLGEDYLETTSVEAEEQGRIYSASIEPERNFAINWWPGMADDWNVPGFLSPFTPVAGFVFSVEEMAVYEINAFSDMDVCLTLLRRDGDNVEYISSNDDYGDLGSDSRVIEPLPQGEYIALVSPYGSGEGEVSFYWQETDVPVSVLRPGRTIEENFPYETSYLMYSMNLAEDRSYTISAESDQIDLVITVILADGSRLTDDDGGEGTNSLLVFSPSPDQSGECYLLVTKYSEAEGDVSISLE